MIIRLRSIVFPEPHGKPSTTMQTISDKSELRRLLLAWRRSAERIALVPTMGSLHDGHLSLARVAREHADRVVVTVFVNPTQFGADEDFDVYPRSLQKDQASLAAENVDILFTPDLATMYPFGIDAATRVIVPVMTDELCGSSRPGHFDGVTSVVARLFALVQPDIAVFGQKDYQQQLVIRRMVDDLSLPVEIVVAPVVREADGLAMSSRNAYLDAEQRRSAASIYQVLRQLAEEVRTGNRDFTALQQEAVESLGRSVKDVDYVAIRQADTLAAPDSGSQQLAILVAAYVGDVRLIDNIVVDIP